MKKNIKLILEYDGSRYDGWQKQGNTDNTIQGKLESILQKWTGEEIEIHGSGRTDAGVHAKGQVANFHTTCDMPTGEMLKYMNSYLPQDIAVTAVEEAGERFHSRLNVVRKCYRYQVWNSEIPNVFQGKYLLSHPEPLDIEAMRLAASYLTGEHDFKAFTSNKKGKKSTVRRIERITIEKDGPLITFSFCGNGFLYHMVRILTGTLLEVGRGIRISQRSTYLCVEVENTGSTIKEEDIDRIFNKFYQADTTHTKEGNGIGLSIVKNIINLHGGRIYVESKDNKTCFSVFLPL